MTSTHTLGPWRAVVRANQHGPQSLAVDMPREGRAWSPDRDNYHMTNRDVEIAVLIAEAPETAAERDRLREINAELLAALDAFVERGTKLSGHPAQYNPWVGELVYARAVLAKAKGESE